MCSNNAMINFAMFNFREIYIYIHPKSITIQ